MGFFSFINKQFPAIVTLLIIACFGLVYFLIYLPQNEKNIRKQRFRALQNLDRNIADKIDNSKKLLGNLLEHYPKDTNYIKNFPQDKFRLSFLTTNPKKSVDTLKGPFDLRIEKKTNDQFTLSVAPNGKKQLDETLGDSCDVIIDNATKKIVLTCRSLSTQRDSLHYEISMSFSFQQFFGSLLSLYSDLFDHFVIIKNKTAVFQDFPAGISEIEEDSLLDGKPGIHVSSMHDINLGGVDYKIFSQPINIGERFTVNGLVGNHRFQKERTQLPTQIILFLVLLVLAIILLFPWLKLVHMGSKDRLTLWDPIATISASMVLMSLLFLFFLEYNSHPTVEHASSQNKFLANNISAAFQAEIRDIYTRLRLVDLIRRDSGVTNSYMMIRNDNITAYPSYQRDPNSAKHIDNKTIKAVLSNPAIKYVYWLDSTGEEKSIWATDTLLAPHGKYKYRAYFSKIMDNKTYFLSNAREYYLDQIVSWITGDFRSVISIPSLGNDSVAVAAVTFDMQSLRDVVLPPGFLFAMISDSARVLYHSESFRNLNESLLSEFSNQDKLKSCLIAHRTCSFKTDYFNKHYRIYVKPIAGLPYSIVLMEDLAYEQTRDANVFSFSFCMLFFFFLFLTLQTIVVYVVAPKKSFFKRQFFDASWIGPKQSNKPDYRLASVFNISLIILVIIAALFTSFLAYLFILLCSAISSPIFSNFLYARKYEGNNPDWYKIKRKVINCLFVIILLLDFTSLFLLHFTNVLLLVGYEFVVFFVGILVYPMNPPVSKPSKKKLSHFVQVLLSVWQKLKKKIFDLNNKLSPRLIPCVLKAIPNKDSFSFMALTRLIITSAIPIVFFYTSSFNYEQNISTRNRQSLFLTNVADKLATESASGQTANPNNAIYYDSLIVSSPPHSNGLPAADHLTAEEVRANALLKQFRLRLTDESVSEEDFDEPSSDDEVFVYKNGSKGAFRRSNTTFRKGNRPSQDLLVESGNFTYHFPRLSNLDSVLFCLVILACLVIFFFIIRGIVRKMFGLQVPDLTKAFEFDREILKDPTLSRLVFVVGPPGAGKRGFIEAMVKGNTIKSVDNKNLFFAPSEKSNCAIADMFHIPDSSNDAQDKTEWSKHLKTILDEKNKLIVVNHFEYNIQDPATNRTKLNFLEKLMLDEKRKIIILSTIHPVAFLDSVFFGSNKQTSATGKKNKNNEEDQSGKAMPEDLERWHVLLGHYRIVLMKLKNKKINPRDGDNDVKAMIERETQWGQFLNNMRQAALDAAQAPNQQIKDELPSADGWAFKMQTTSYYFYMYVWQSLTREEKFLLYDLAEDNLVNPCDDYNLSMLIGKGLIIRDDDTLKLFNDGFRNFILTAIGNTEVMKIKDQIRDNGYWGKLKNPLTIVIVAILAFLLASQEETFTKLIAYLTALVGGIPIILRLFSLFSKGSQQSS
jgi:hypothetical protein